MKYLQDQMRHLMAQNNRMNGYSIELIERYQNIETYKLKIKLEFNKIFMNIVRSGDIETLGFFAKEEVQDIIDDLKEKHHE